MYWGDKEFERRTDVTEPLRLRVAIVVNTALLVLSAIVPGQLEDSLPARNGVFGIALRTGVGLGVCQEVQVEPGVLVLGCAHQGHSHDLLVEFQTGFGRLDAEHGVVQTVSAGVGGGALALVMATDDLHPVSVRILDERNALHAAIREFLLERIPRIFQSLARLLDVVDRNRQMTESTVGFCVAVDNTVVGIAFRAVVVG